MITHLEAIPVALPVRRVWKWRGLGGDLGRWVIVRLHADDGLVGLGEATPLPDWGGDFNRYAGESPATVVHVVEEILRPVLFIPIAEVNRIRFDGHPDVAEVAWAVSRRDVHATRQRYGQVGVNSASPASAVFQISRAQAR